MILAHKRKFFRSCGNLNRGHFSLNLGLLVKEKESLINQKEEFEKPLKIKMKEYQQSKVKKHYKDDEVLLINSVWCKSLDECLLRRLYSLMKDMFELHK